MVKRPEQYKWSSYGRNAWGDKSWLTSHNEYKQPGATLETRCHNYRMLFKDHLDDADVDLIRKAAHYCQPVGDDRFKQMIEKKYGIKMGLTRRDRPKMNDEVGMVKI